MRPSICRAKLGIAAFATALGIVAGATTAFAANTYIPVSGTSCDFNKYLVMDAGDTVPNATFAFTVAPGTARSASGSSYAVLAGVGSPTIANVTFAPTDTTATAAGTNIDVARSASDRASGLTAATGVQLETGEKYATKAATVDFSGVSFSEPGIYRYVISETANAINAAKGIMNDNDTDRILDVYVIDTDGTLSVSAYVLHLNDEDVTPAGNSATTLADKTDGFTNECNTRDLEISNSVAGNAGSKDKYFDMIVTMTGINPDDQYVVSIADDGDSNTNDGNADATSGAEKPGGTIAANANKPNPTTVTGAELLAGQHFYLQDGQSVVIRGLPTNASYTLTENNEDYVSSVPTGKVNSGVVGDIDTSGKLVLAGFINTRNTTIPTGVFLYAGIGILAIAFAGGMFVLTRKNKDTFE